MDKIIMYTGSYSEEKSITVYNFDTRNGTVDFLMHGPVISKASYLCVGVNGCLYAVMENSETGRTGGVAAFRIDSYGGLSDINRLMISEMGPCHLSVDKSCRYLAVANYGEGSVSLLSLNPDGSIGKLLDTVYHQGALGPRKDRQDKSHAHYVMFTEDAAKLFVCDLGLDMVIFYKISPDGKLKASKECSITLKPGSGPRHFVKNRQFMYIINELSNDVSVYEESKSGFQMLQNITTLPENFIGDSAASAIHFSDDRKLLYCSNRGHDSIAVFSVDSASGLLTAIGHFFTDGAGPRDFYPVPGNKYIVVANQVSDSLTVLKIMPDGSLESSGKLYHTDKPTCVIFKGE